MADRRDPDKRLLGDLYRLKRRVQALEEERAEYLERILAGRLRHPSDFERFIGLATVIDDDGRIDWMRLEQRVSALLRERPELAA